MFKSIFQFLRKYWKSILWIGFILYGTLTPSDHLPKSKLLEINYMDLVIHFFLWAIMMFLFLIEMHYYKNPVNVQKHALQAFYFCIALGLLSELAQYYFIASRTGNIFDFLADSFGASVMFLIFFLLKRKRTSS